MRRCPYRGRENMFADRAYSRGLVAPPDRLASLLYFAAAVPAVGFIHGAPDLSALNAAALEGYVEDRFINRARRESIRARGDTRDGGGGVREKLAAGVKESPATSPTLRLPTRKPFGRSRR